MVSSSAPNTHEVHLKTGVSNSDGKTSCPVGSAEWFKNLPKGHVNMKVHPGCKGHVVLSKLSTTIDGAFGKCTPSIDNRDPGGKIGKLEKMPKPAGDIFLDIEIR
jgi:hypothetical protein